MTLAAGAFIGLQRGERHGVSGGQEVAGGLKQLNCLGLESRRGSGLLRRWACFLSWLLRGLRKRCPNQEEQPEYSQQGPAWKLISHHTVPPELCHPNLRNHAAIEHLVGD